MIPFLVVSPAYSSQIIASAKFGTLPDHLKFLPPSIPIPERYTWVVLHRGWIPIPKVNSDKFSITDNPPIVPTDVDPLNEELVDWGDDDDNDFLEEEFSDVVVPPEDCEDCDDPVDPVIITSAS